MMKKKKLIKNRFHDEEHANLLNSMWYVIVMANAMHLPSQFIFKTNNQFENEIYKN